MSFFILSSCFALVTTSLHWRVFSSFLNSDIPLFWFLVLINIFRPSPSSTYADSYFLFSPRIRHRIFIGKKFYDYYGFFCNPKVHQNHITMIFRVCFSQLILLQVLAMHPELLDIPRVSTISFNTCPPLLHCIVTIQTIGIRDRPHPLPYTLPT